jgi:Cu+-exporting ATPase
MKNLTPIMFVVLVVIALATYFFVHQGSAQSAQTINSGSGDYQKVVLSMQNGNYYPNTITVDSGKPVRVYLDSSVQGCYRSFFIPSFGVQKYFPSSQDYVEFTPDKPGSYGFRCGMGMGHGVLTVK